MLYKTMQELHVITSGMIMLAAFKDFHEESMLLVYISYIYVFIMTLDEIQNYV